MKKETNEEKIVLFRFHHGQSSIAIILEYQSVNNVKSLLLWYTNSGCNNLPISSKCHPITVTADNLFQIFLVGCSGILTWSVNNAHVSSIL